MKHVSCLWIPDTFIAALPAKAKNNTRYRVAWFQYHMLLVTALRNKLPMPPRVPGQMIPASTSVSPWYGKLRGWTIPTEKNLGEQVHYCQVKRKQRPTRVPQIKDPAK